MAGVGKHVFHHEGFGSLMGSMVGGSNGAECIKSGYLSSLCGHASAVKETTWDQASPVVCVAPDFAAQVLTKLVEVFTGQLDTPFVTGSIREVGQKGFKSVIETSGGCRGASG